MEDRQSGHRLVPEDARKILDAIISGTTLVSRGAESEIRTGNIGHAKAVFKVRTPKPYMHPKLDFMLRRQRTVREARVIAAARAAGVSAPRLLLVLPSLGLLAMEFVEGPTLRDHLNSGISEDDARSLAFEAGVILGRLHATGIVHGDPTTSNYIVSPRGLVLIDYGLADFSDSTEERAVDLHLFRRAVEATHPSLSQLIIESFQKGYKKSIGAVADRIIARAKEIALMGRYVEERRTVWSANST